MNNEVELIEIDIDRDSVLAAGWINSPGGAEMLQLMGMIVPNDFITTVAIERNRLKEMHEDPNELIWMIEYKGKVVGIVEVHTVPFEGLQAPNTSIMVGDASVRGRGVGTAANRLMLQKLKDLGFRNIFARVLIHNTASTRMLAKLGFINDGATYTDKDGLTWQNVKLAV